MSGAVAIADRPAPLPAGISVVVPVYNSEGSLAALAERLAQALPACAPGFELILVNDASRDGSWAVVERLARDYAWVRGFDLARNFGQHNALLCGILAARYDRIVTMDDDLQHPPEEIGAMLSAMSDGVDVVYGSPRERSHGLWRDVASAVTKTMLQATLGARTARRASAFRLFRTRLREAFADYRGPMASVDVLLTWVTDRFTYVEVRHDERLCGASNYTFRKLVRHALNMMTGFSILPLQMASLAGFFFSAFGFALLVYIVARFLVSGTPVPGFPFLASTIAIFSGI